MIWCVLLFWLGMVSWLWFWCVVLIGWILWILDGWVWWWILLVCYVVWCNVFWLLLWVLWLDWMFCWGILLWCFLICMWVWLVLFWSSDRVVLGCRVNFVWWNVLLLWLSVCCWWCCGVWVLCFLGCWLCCLWIGCWLDCWLRVLCWLYWVVLDWWFGGYVLLCLWSGICW